MNIISGDADRYNHRIGNNDYSQPRALFNLFDASQKQRLFSNLAATTVSVPPSKRQGQASSAKSMQLREFKT